MYLTPLTEEGKAMLAQAAAAERERNLKYDYARRTLYLSGLFVTNLYAGTIYSALEAEGFQWDAEAMQWQRTTYVQDRDWAWHCAYADERRRNGEPGISLITFTTYCEDINEAWMHAEAYDIGLWMKRGMLRDSEPVTYLLNPIGAWDAAHAEYAQRTAAATLGRGDEGIRTRDLETQGELRRFYNVSDFINDLASGKFASKNAQEQTAALLYAEAALHQPGARLVEGERPEPKDIIPMITENKSYNFPAAPRASIAPAVVEMIIPALADIIHEAAVEVADQECGEAATVFDVERIAGDLLYSLADLLTLSPVPLRGVRDLLRFHQLDEVHAADYFGIDVAPPLALAADEYIFVPLPDPATATPEQLTRLFGGAENADNVQAALREIASLATEKGVIAGTEPEHAAS